MVEGMPKLLATAGEGERLDRFELVAELASGGMATVYLARLSGVAGFQRLVAIKRLHPHLAKEPDFIEMFLDEARLAARIHHPNVVPIQEVGESGNGYYLVMDYIEGDTLARLLSRAAQAKAQIPWGVTIRVILDTLAGLHSAHELKDDLGHPLAIVHRDVSPQNILVGSDGIARITDFGVARAASRLSTTRSGQLKGKLAYMAPEQARGEAVDRRADVFSCGIVLWEALAMKRLFRGEGEAATLNRVLHDAVVPPSSIRSDVPRELDEICMKALDRDVDKRFATADVFADELERAARKLSCVGSVREVAACLEEVFGSDLVQQREAVRAWLARSEPSAPPRSRASIPDSGQTRVDGGSPHRERGSLQRGRGSLQRGRGRGESFAPPSASRGHVDRRAVTAPEPPSAATGSLPPDKVSSVSSTVLPVPGSDSGQTYAVARPRWSLGGVVAMVAVAALLAGVGTWGANRLGASTPGARTATPTSATRATATQGTATVAPPPALPTSSEASKPRPVATEAPSAVVPGVESATTASVNASPPNRPTLRRPVSAAPKPTGVAVPSTTATSVPDDLSKNPYR
jgi:serine/threonine-protein kinase